MDKILEVLINLIPFAMQFETWGMNKETSVTLSTLINTALLCGIGFLFKHLLNRYKTTRAARQLAPYFDYQKVKASRRFFIPSRGQNCSPAHEDEPKTSSKFIVKQPLIPFFIKVAFNEKKETEKFYLILADSGMGKTTFMINLFVCYTSFFNSRRKYKIRLFPFGDSRILDEIKAINREEKLTTILLLDAFDEDRKLIPPAEPDGLTDDTRFRKRLDEIIEAVQDFREVVITSRTQYFPGQEDKPYELKIPRFDDKGFHTLSKLYLSPFNDSEIKCYLRKKYGVLRFWNWKRRKTAATIVDKSPKLMVRPMLLGYIDYLVGSKRVFNNTYEIYETLVNKWLERESTKRRSNLEERGKFKQDLAAYSRLVALEIYTLRKQTELLSLPKETAVGISSKNKLDLYGYEITGQSLLTRDAAGCWKFAHKSIWEFFIAKEVTKNLEFYAICTLDTMDMALQFFSEKRPNWPLPGYFVFIKGGTFLMGSPEGEAERSGDETQHPVKVNNFLMAKYTVTVAEFETFVRETNYWDADAIAEQKEKQHPVVNVSWEGAVAYCNWLSKKLNPAFRLPTEAEWEYACRAGTITPFNTGENLTMEQANYDGNYPYKNYPKGKKIGKTTPVGSYPPNGWGLYDMHGNVWEWCLDRYGEKYYDACKKAGIVDNPKGPEIGSGRVLRGGSWSRYMRSCRSGYRGRSNSSDCNDAIGFRLVFVPQAVGSSSGL